MPIPPGGRAHGSLTDADGLHEPKGAAAAVDQSELSVASGVSYWKRRANQLIPVTSNGQTVFALSNAAKADDYAHVVLNNVDATDQFTIAGTVLTFIGVDFALETTDVLWARYHF